METSSYAILGYLKEEVKCISVGFSLNPFMYTMIIKYLIFPDSMTNARFFFNRHKLVIMKVIL